MLVAIRKWSGAWRVVAAGTIALSAACSGARASSWDDAVAAVPPGDMLPVGDAGDACLEAVRAICCPD